MQSNNTTILPMNNFEKIIKCNFQSIIHSIDEHDIILQLSQLDLHKVSFRYNVIDMIKVDNKHAKQYLIGTELKEIISSILNVSRKQIESALYIGEGIMIKKCDTNQYINGLIDYINDVIHSARN
jgi:hypothetical protein